MTRKIFIILFISLAIPFIIKAEWVPLNKLKKEKTPPTVTLLSEDDNSTVLKIDISGFDVSDFVTDGKSYQKLDLLSETFTTIPGFPELPYIAKVLAIPDLSGVSIEILETGAVETFSNITLPPARESWFEGSPETNYTENADAYKSLSTYPAELAQFEQPSIFRDFRITRVSIYPFRYIAAKKELQAVSSITVRINYGQGEVVNPKTGDKKPIAPSFGQLYKSLIFNYQSVLDKFYGGKEEGHELMLCIMPDEFVTSFQTYATWKRQSGIDIHVTKFSDIGANATNPDIIKNHITDAYHNWVVPPTYVLIVGDNGIFPHKIVNYDYSFPNDDFFVEIDGNDYFPEMMIGRFTNESDYQMQVMINKFIKYEKTPYTASTDWFKKGICCSNNAYPSQIQTKREAANYMLNDGGFTSVDTMMSDPGCTYNVADVVTAINSGRSWLNYRGEGWSYGWWATCTPLHTDNLTSINNGQKFTFITSIGCGVAMFNDGTANCFGETWLEMGTLSAPKGAAAFVGPTSNTHTAYNNNIDRGIYRGMFQEGMETPGQALLRGKLYMYNVFGGADSWVEYHYRVYTVLGDPSIHIWKDIPKAINVNYVAAIPFGSNIVEFTVTHTSTGLPVANALVCITGNALFATGITDAAGKAYVEITSEVQETLKVTVRGGNVIPYIGTLEMIQPTGPFIIKEAFSLNDLTGGNGDGLLDYDESILMSLAVKNVGTVTANSVNVTISTIDPYITITDNFHNYGNIAANQTILATNAFAFSVAENIPDEHSVLITITAVSGANTWYSNITIDSHAPILSAGNITISDPGGNNNGRIDPGETVTFTVAVNNTGHSSSPAASAILSSASPYITINTGTSVLGQIAGGGSTNAVFNITCSTSTPIGQSVDLTMDVDAGFFSFGQTFYPSVGLVLEDWELGNFTRFPWTFDGDANWAVVSADQYEGAFTARSGAIEDNETSELNLTLIVNIAGPISFYRQTSSEANYDFLRFYIDGLVQAEWSGTVDWGQVSFPVTIGEHTFKWTYSKDGSVVAGDDCAWVDYIVFPSCTILAPEINVTPASFSRTLVLGGTANDLLTIANTGTTPLNFTAQIDFPGSGKSLATVYPYNYSYGTGSCNNSAKTQTSLVKGYPPTENGWMKFDVSSIPDGAIINSVEFHGFVNANNYPYWSITPVTNDPITTAAATLYADINAEANTGFYLWINETGTIANDWVSHMLGGNVNADLQAALAQNWFAIGIMDRDNSTYYINFDGWNEANKPYLVIDYSYTPTASWLKIDGGTVVPGTIEAGGNQNVPVTFDAGSYPQGTYQANIIINSNDTDEPQVIAPCTLVINNGINVSVKAILEGPFNATAMGTGINALLPLSQPYTASPWLYTGTESVAIMPANVVDWVLVELRAATSPANATLATIIARKAGLLLSNGNIVDMDGTSPLFFNNSFSNNLYVVIHQRNHLSILSANAVTLNGENYSYDFTTSVGQAFGTNSQKLLTTGKWGMMCGDVNGNGLIDAADLNPAWKTNAGKTGLYLPADLNFDRHINNKDKDSFWYLNKGKGTNVPQ